MIKPHIKLKRGQWEMSGWHGDEGYPMIAISISSLPDALAYFACILRTKAKCQ